MQKLSYFCKTHFLMNKKQVAFHPCFWGYLQQKVCKLYLSSLFFLCKKGDVELTHFSTHNREVILL